MDNCVQDELPILSELIPSMKDLRSLTVTCNDVNDIPKIAANAKKVSKADRANIPLSKFQTDTTKFWRGVAKFLIRSSTVTKVTMNGVWLSDHSWDSLAKGLAGNKSVTTLTVNHCRMGGLELSKMVPSLLSSQFVSLDVSHNRIDDDGARSIAHLIAWHADQRDMVVQNYGLRGDCPLGIEASHLQEVDISHNSITDIGMQAVCEKLNSDRWLKAISLKGVMMGDACRDELLHSIKINPTLLLVDLRSVESVRQEHLQVLTGQVKRNMTQFMNSYKDYLNDEQKMTAWSQMHLLSALPKRFRKGIDQSDLLWMDEDLDKSALDHVVKENKKQVKDKKEVVTSRNGSSRIGTTPKPKEKLARLRKGNNPDRMEMLENRCVTLTLENKLLRQQLRILQNHHKVNYSSVLNQREHNISNLPLPEISEIAVISGVSVDRAREGLLEASRSFDENMTFSQVRAETGGPHTQDQIDQANPPGDIVNDMTSPENESETVARINFLMSELERLMDTMEQNEQNDEDTNNL